MKLFNEPTNGAPSSTDNSSQSETDDEEERSPPRSDVRPRTATSPEVSDDEYCEQSAWKLKLAKDVRLQIKTAKENLREYTLEKPLHFDLPRPRIGHKLNDYLPVSKQIQLI